MSDIDNVMHGDTPMVYSFFDPDFAQRSIGSFLILDHIEHARSLNLPYVYLGYWVNGSEKMNYKAEFRPLEVLDGDTWRDIQEL